MLFVALVLGFYLWHCFGVTIGLHRLLSHRSFKCSKFLEYQWVLAAYLAFHGSPLWWATMHRAHHRHVDTPLDPHAPMYGAFKAFTFFTPFDYAAHIDPAKQSPDLLRDPVYRFLECGGNWRLGYALNVVICLGFRAALWYFFGWQVALASLIAGIIALNVPLILNIVCHIPRLGTRNFDTPDESVNVGWMAILCLGEGWHNNHHAHPGSARSGKDKSELDLSWMILQALRKFSLITEVNEFASMKKTEPVKELVGRGSR